MRATGGGGVVSRTVSVCGYACHWGGGGSVKDSVSMWLCVLLQVDGCQGQCACHDGWWCVGGGGVKDSVGLWLCVLL